MDNIQRPLPLPLPPPGGAQGFNPLAPPPGSAPAFSIFSPGQLGGQQPAPELPLVLPEPVAQRQPGPAPMPYQNEENGLKFLDFIKHWGSMARPFQPVIIKASAYGKGVKVNTLAQRCRGGRLWVIANCGATDPSAVDIAERTSFVERHQQDCVSVTLKAAENPYISAMELEPEQDFTLLQGELIAWINAAPTASPGTKFERYGLAMSTHEQQWVNTQLSQLPLNEYVPVIMPHMIVIHKVKA